MNDDFLHHIRKAPPPEFLAGLKARLDRQPMMPPPRGRWGFARGLIAGLLLGGAAFALTAVSLNRGPEALRTLVKAPAHFLARLMPGGAGQSAQQEQTQHRVVPLGPVWLPEHPGESRGGLEVAPASATVTSTGSATNPATARSSSAVVSGSAYEGARPAPATILASTTTFALATNTVGRLKVGGYDNIQVELERETPFDRLCSVNSPGAADVAELSRRITQDEFRRCAASKNVFARAIVEVKVGYQAVGLVRARLYGPLKLTARDLFLGLAQQVPDPSPAHPESLIDNPYKTWNQVDSTLPYDPIQLIAPTTNSDGSELIADLLLQAGCNTYPWIAALRTGNPRLYQEVCGTLREDGAYTEAGPAGWAYTDLLTTNPTALGVLPYRSLPETLLFNPIDGVELTTVNLAAGAYPAGRPIYFYANKYRILGNQIFTPVVRFSMAPRATSATDLSAWGFVPLDGNESATSLATAQSLKEMQF